MATRRRPYTQRTDAGGRWTYNRERGLDRWACAADQWQMVLSSVPETLLASADRDAALREYNEAASDYRALTFHHRARFAKGSPVIAWRRRRKHLEAALQGLDESTNRAFRVHVNEALAYVDRAAIPGFEIAGSAHHGRRPERDGLYRDLLGIWIKRFNGKLTTGRPIEGERVANSPAIRFLLAALAPILDHDDMIGPEAAEKIIEAEIARREQMPKMTAHWMELLAALKRRARRRHTR